ncbi:hypothetical protein AA313_de0202537 [Arthrobotrys entomopaga]|nr:hypothetical protein AA313_de0202537 [Arthrobotrys entomopaga]
MGSKDITMTSIIPEEQNISTSNTPISPPTAIVYGEAQEVYVASSTNQPDTYENNPILYHNHPSKAENFLATPRDEDNGVLEKQNELMKHSIDAIPTEHSQNINTDTTENSFEVTCIDAEVEFETFVKELQEEVTAVDVQADTQIQETPEDNNDNPFNITIETEYAKQIDGVYYPSPGELQFSSGSRVYPDTPVTGAISSTLKDTPLDEIEGPTDDSRYESGRKRIRLSVQQYKSKRTPQYTGGDERLAFDRICPNSKFYHTQPDPDRDPVRRVLFPTIRKKKETRNSSENADRPQALIEDGKSSKHVNNYKI